MKRFLFIIPLFLLSLLLYTIEPSRNSSQTIKNDFESQNSYVGNKNRNISTGYKIYVDFNPDKKLLTVEEKIIWKNLTEYSTDEIQFHLYANAFSNNETELGKKFGFDESERTKILIHSLAVNGIVSQFEYFQPEVYNPHDSTVARINLDKPVLPGDSVLIDIEYELIIPRGRLRFGYAAGREFYFIAQWFPKLGVFKDGHWICSQYHPYTEFYSDFANYDVIINLPTDYIVGSTGQLINVVISDSIKSWTYSAKNVIDFAWTASPEFYVQTKKYKSNFGKDIEVNFLIQPENKNLIDRKFKAAFNTVEYLEKYIGEFPYSQITLVDAPRTANIGGMEYPTIITYFTPLFSPIETQRPESTIIHEIVHQYFYAAVSSNEVYEAWLDEGLATYLEAKILSEYYGNPILYFRFIDYYPIYGISFLSFREIPLIYSLKAFEFEHSSYALSSYYLNNEIGSIRDTSYALPNRLSYLVNAYSKPYLIVQVLENYLGKDEILEIISEYYNKYKFSLVTADDFLNVLKNYENLDLEWFIANFINGSKKFDYKISSIAKEESTYKIFVERLEGGIAPTEIAVYSEVDTTYIEWDGTDRWKIFNIESEHKIIAAEVDPFRKNILDINYANNSYTVEPKYWASLSIAIRWFFWVQNSLLIFGSVG
ncbi:MAG TPA: M1 family peptidase [Ignavibacteria bacterium]|nr:M1 family peptidase [Ignavibacteria bacterium]